MNPAEPKAVFIGREAKLETFGRILRQFRIRSAFPIPGKPRANVTFVLGKKRLGKTTLCRQALGQRVIFPPMPKVVWVRPVSEQVSGSSHPGSNPLLDAIYTAFVEIEKYQLKEYEGVQLQLASTRHELERAVKEKIPEEAKKDLGDALDHLVGIGVTALIDCALTGGNTYALSVTEFSKVFELARDTSKSVRIVAPHILQLFRDCLAGSPDHRRTVERHRDNLRRALGHDLHTISQNQSLIILLERYEQYLGRVRGCNSDLRHIIHSVGPQVLWIVIAALEEDDPDLSLNEWEEEFSEGCHLIKVQPLSVEEIETWMIQSFLVQDGEKVRKTAGEIRKITEGLPESVREVVEVWRLGGFDEVVETHTGTGSSESRSAWSKKQYLEAWIKDRSNQRYLKLLFAIAILHPVVKEAEKGKIFRSICGPDVDIAAELRDLEQRCLYFSQAEGTLALDESFLAVLREKLMSDKIAQMVYTSELDDIHTKACLQIAEEQGEVEKSHGLDSYQKRVADMRWKELETARLYHLLWWKTHVGWSQLSVSLLVALRYDRGWFDKLADMVRELTPIFPQSYQAMVQMVEAARVSGEMAPIDDASLTEKKIELVSSLARQCGCAIT
jgi:hypothetical protein